MTAGTIFDKTRTPLTVWFHACWLFATAKDGISAQHLQRVPEISSYQTTSAMLTGFSQRWCGRAVTAVRHRRGRSRPASAARLPVCRRSSAARRSSPGSPSKFQPKDIGRCPMAPLDDASGDTLGTFVTENVQPGATVITDGWAAYRAISGKGYQHRPINQKAARAAGDDPDSLLPGVHRVASLCKRWLLGTHQGSVRRRAPARLSQRVRLPVQPPPIGQPGHGVLPGPAASRRPRASPVRGSARQQKATPCEASRGRHGTPSEPRAPSGGPPVADRRNPAAVSSPVKWIPRSS